MTATDSAQQPLRLTAMTLRGVGSYLEGARLEIRPLTILCGKNGAGKSTWFKALNILHREYRRDGFPFQELSDADGACGNEYTNAWLRWGAAETSEALCDPDADREFGPWGTLGLEFIADHDFICGAKSAAFFNTPATASPAWDFIRNGRCPQGMKLRLRIAHLTSDLFDDVVPFAQDFVELTLNQQCRIRFSKPHAGSNPSIEPYMLECSASLLGLPAADSNEMRKIAEIWPPREGEPMRVYPVESFDALFAIETFCRDVIARIRGFLDQFFSGYFYISAIRNLQGETGDHNFNGERGRYVGANAQHALDCERRYAYNRMHWFGTPGERVNQLLKAEPYVFEAWVSAWLHELAQARFVELFEDANGRSLGDLWIEEEIKPAGFLQEARPNPIKEPHERDEAPESLHRLMHTCFGRGESYYKQVAPDRMSAGFHQIAPLVIQAGLMFPNEVVAIENPEVHLHPSLQLELTAFLLEQARSGRLIIVETHSDLVIRRVLREILEERTAQSLISISFAALEDGPDDYTHSKLQRLETDESGQIANWPEGFLDDDIKESRRLFKVMYGALPEAEGEDDL